MSDKHNLEILNCIYKNSKMAADSIEQVTSKYNKNDDFREYLNKQHVKYVENCNKLCKQINGFGDSTAPVPTAASIMSKVGIDMKTFSDSSRQNIAKLMYEGTNMGIVDITRVVNRSTNADCTIVEQAKMLLNTEQDYANGLKRFL